MKSCPFCFAQNPDDSVFCLSCGQNMSVVQQPVAQDAPVYQQPQQDVPVYQQPQQEAPMYQQPPVGGYAPPQQQAPPSGFVPPPQPYAPPTYQAPQAPQGPQAYGAPPQPMSTKPPKVGNPAKNWAGVMGMILGILSLVLCCIPYLSPFLGIGGLIFSIMGLKSQRKGMAVAGLITSIFGTIIAIIYVIILVFALSMPSWLESVPGFSYSFNESLF